MKQRRPATTEEINAILPVIKRFGLSASKNIQRFIDTEFDKIYDVYLVGEKYVVKKLDTSSRDLNKYNLFFKGLNFAVPEIRADFQVGENSYILMNYISAVDARDCTPEQARTVVLELARIHSNYLVSGGHTESSDIYYSKYVKPDFDSSKVLIPEGESVFEALTKRFFEAPHTLVHDDLLPINVLFEGKKVWIIDWATAGIYPYFLDLARFCYVFCSEYYDHISKDASDAFLETYYVEMSKNKSFTVSREQFRLDVAYSAFIQYSMFLAGVKDVNKTKCSVDYAYFKRIAGYLIKQGEIC